MSSPFSILWVQRIPDSWANRPIFISYFPAPTTMILLFSHSWWKGKTSCRKCECIARLFDLEPSRLSLGLGFLQHFTRTGAKASQLVSLPVSAPLIHLPSVAWEIFLKCQLDHVIHSLASLKFPNSLVWYMKLYIPCLQSGFPMLTLFPHH